MPTRTLVAVAVAGVTLLQALVPAAHAAPVRVNNPNVPFYGRVLHGEEWTAVVFYRPAECVPRDFDIEAFFAGPRAFACGPMTVSGFAIYENGPPPIYPGPKQARFRGEGDVDVWLIPTPTYELASADGVVTIADILAMNPLTGSASFYSEVLHIRPPDRAFQHYGLVARGTLDDGRTFFLRILRTPGESHLEVSLG
jgi:hypothetical protein